MKSPFALIQEIRQWFDGLVALSGSIASGGAVLAAQAMGADFAYIGTAFIATEEARASDDYKQAIVAGSSDDIVYSSLFTGVHGNYLAPSIVAAGMDPNNLPEGDLKTMNFGGGEGSKTKALEGHLGLEARRIGAITEVATAAAFIREAEGGVLPPRASASPCSRGDAVADLPQRPAAGRMPLLDAVKGVACLLIVGHHLVRYGPLAEGAAPLAPRLFAWLSEDGRLAVQVFLVIAGFLAAASLAPAGLLRSDRSALRALYQRYGRLVMPYLAALICTVLVAAAVRPWLDDEAVPGTPSLPQLIAHGLLLQDLLGYEALLGGCLAMWRSTSSCSPWPSRSLPWPDWMQRRWNMPRAMARARWLGVALVAGLVVGSLLVFNRQASLDITAIYFFGAYGLGMLGYWIGRATRDIPWRSAVAVVGMLGLAALAVDWRSRIALALVTALAVILADHRREAGWRRSIGPGWPCTAAASGPDLLFAVPDPLFGDPAGQRGRRAMDAAFGLGRRGRVAGGGGALPPGRDGTVHAGRAAAGDVARAAAHVRRPDAVRDAHRVVEIDGSVAAHGRAAP